MSPEQNLQRVFVKVVGFTDVERHALNTVFRLSLQRDTMYSLWSADAPAPPKLALIDGQSYEARLELAVPHDPRCKLIWVGSAVPDPAWRAFERPLSWSAVLEAMDEACAPRDLVDFDLDAPPGEAPRDPGRRALIASADRGERLYLRAKLALAELTQADEAETGARALELTRSHRYAVALVDFALPDVDGWAMLKELLKVRPVIPNVIVTKASTSAGERVRAWLAGAKGCLDKPPHPGKLQELLLRV